MFKDEGVFDKGMIKGVFEAIQTKTRWLVIKESNVRSHAQYPRISSIRNVSTWRNALLQQLVTICRVMLSLPYQHSTDY